MCGGTNIKQEDGRFCFGKQIETPLVIQLALCASIWRPDAAHSGSQAAPCYISHFMILGNAKQIPSKPFSFFLDHSLAAVQLFRKCNVPFPVSLRLKLRGWESLGLAQGIVPS